MKCKTIQTQKSKTQKFKTQKFKTQKSKTQARFIATAKNYLKQEIEVATSGKTSRVVVKKHNGMFLFRAKGKSIATLHGSKLHIFCESAKVGDIHVPDHVKTIDVAQIQRKKTLYCCKENRWMSFNASLHICRCHSYLKVRTRFFVGLIQVENSDEMAQIAAAKADIKNAERTEKALRAKNRRIPSVGLSTQVSGVVVNKSAEDRTTSAKSFFIECVSLKVNGQIIEDERKFQPLLELMESGQR